MIRKDPHLRHSHPPSLELPAPIILRATAICKVIRLSAKKTKISDSRASGLRGFLAFTVLEQSTPSYWDSFPGAPVDRMRKQSWVTPRWHTMREVPSRVKAMCSRSDSSSI